jgi:hypothetical protein
VLVNDREGDQKAHNLLVNGVQHGPPIKILTKIYVTKVFNQLKYITEQGIEMPVKTSAF